MNNFFWQLLLINIAIMLSLNSKAQQRTCGTMNVLQKQLEESPNLFRKMNEIEQNTRQSIERSSVNRGGIETTFTIPVVVHVIYQTETQNISNAQVLSQIEVLNKDFRRTNTDTTNTWPQAADTKIEFCMATIDPNGNATNGITRKLVNKSSWGVNDAMKSVAQGGVNAWPTNSYLNIWVCNIGGGILGYAQFPGGNAATDGVVISPQFFGNTGSVQPPFNGGRTSTHEVGHWLNLRHIWGDGGCSVDDFISDTPTSDAPNYGCATGHVSCTTVDMVQNYMDYSDDACMNLFTQKQKERMRALFDIEGVRASLLNSNACGGENPVATCLDGVQNQNETGIDCGGVCADCPTACPTNEVILTINFDNYPEENSWEITNAAGNVVASGGPYTEQGDGSTTTITECLNDGCYNFVIKDEYGDGMCCSYGNGYYNLATNGDTLASGATFTNTEVSNFCLGVPKPSCEDGIQNQNETGVDCGGLCVPCSTKCEGNEIDININFDNYPEETSWEITNTVGEILLNGGPYNDQTGGNTLNLTDCLSDGCYNFTINDVYSDGICCNYGNGSYNLSANGTTLISGASFGGSETQNFCFGTETGANCNYETINVESFEIGWGIWNDGGSDSYRNNYAPFASSGKYTIRIRDNSSSSFITSDNISATNYNELTVEFSYYPVELEDEEDFWLQLSTDGGATFTTVKTWLKGTDFVNRTAYRETVTINQTFSNTTKIRFRVDASVNNDRVYFDDVIISGCKVDN